MMPADLSSWLDHQPPSIVASYCYAWRIAPALWLKSWQPGERAQVRLVMKRVCHG
jgi:hypothetical protein